MKPCKLVASLFVTACLSSTAAFAHLSFKGEDQPVHVRAPYNWTGFYAGLNIGGVKHTMNITDNQATTFNATIEQVTNPQFTAGFQVGYRRQLDMNRVSGVYGGEFSGHFSNAEFSKQYGSPFALYQLNAKNELMNLWLLQFIGGIAADRALLFFSAGFSYTDITGNVTNVTGAPFFNSFDVGKKALGTVVGAGVEYAFTDTLSARLKLDVITPNVYSTSDNTGGSFQISNNIVQGTLGINYKFCL